MSSQALAAARPILDILQNLDLSSPEAGERLEAALPFRGPTISAFRTLVERGVADRTLVPKENGGVRFGRLARATPETRSFSIDVVDMDAPGPGHTHPNGEIDLCFALDGQPRFDGSPEGWVIKPPGSWHVPTVSGGRMAIVYFLPDGAIEFGPRPSP